MATATEKAMSRFRQFLGTPDAAPILEQASKEETERWEKLVQEKPAQDAADLADALARRKREEKDAAEVKALNDKARERELRANNALMDDSSAGSSRDHRNSLRDRDIRELCPFRGLIDEALATLRAKREAPGYLMPRSEVEGYFDGRAVGWVKSNSAAVRRHVEGMAAASREVAALAFEPLAVEAAEKRIEAILAAIPDWTDMEMVR